MSIHKYWPLALFCACASAAAPEQIAVSDRYITVLVFDSPLCAVELASDLYAAKIRDNYLMLISKKQNAPPTSLFVTYQNGEAFLHTIVAYADAPPKTYDLRSATAASKKSVTKTNKLLLQGLAYLKTLPQVRKDLGVRADGLCVILTNILADATHFYLKLFVANDTGLDYEIEEVLFCLHSGAKKRQLLTPVVTTQKQQIAAYSDATLCYAFPCYGLKKASKLEITLREANGERNLQCNVPASILLTAPKITHTPPTKRP
ncbi:MAG: DUF4138 domain-containing protein [Bacteroidota bacterium]